MVPFKLYVKHVKKIKGAAYKTVTLTVRVNRPKELRNSLIDFYFNYRPPRSWDKVIFSEACVKNSVHIREQCMLGDTGNKRAVRILLECILVYCNSVSFTDVPTVTQLVRRHGLQPVLHSRRKNHVKVIAKYYLLILNAPSPSIRNVHRDQN